jgi:hypothetical protein
VTAVVIAGAVLVPATESPAGWVPVPRKACASRPSGYVCSTTTQIRFAYPQSWHALPYTTPDLLSRSMIFLSTEPLHDPCTSTTQGAAISITCDWPASSIGPNGVLAEWLVGGKPGWRLSAVAGTPTRIGGRLARITSSTSGAEYENCRRIGAEEVVTAWVARRVPNNLYAFIACLRGPDLQTLEHQVHVLLASTRFPHG